MQAVAAGAALGRSSAATIHEWETNGRQWVIDQDVLPRKCSTPAWPPSWLRHRSAARDVHPDEGTTEDGLNAEVAELLTTFGFELREIREDIDPALQALFVAARLPHGWRKVPGQDSREVRIVDERGLDRAEITIKHTPSELTASMHLTDVSREIASDLAAGFVEDTPWQTLTAAERADLVHYVQVRGASVARDVASTLERAGSETSDADRIATAQELVAALRSAVP